MNIVQNILTAKFPTYGAWNIQGISELKEDSLDVLFLGSSHIVSGIHPMKIYSDMGISSYNLGTSMQRMSGSYYLCKYVMKTQSPSVVVVDAASLFADEENYNYNNIAWRYILDSMPLNDVKFEMANDYSKTNYSDGFLSAIFPILKYHTRWALLSEDDFFNRTGEWRYFPAGNLIDTMKGGTETSFSQVDELAMDLANSKSGKMLSISRGEFNEEQIRIPLYNPELSEDALFYLDRLKDLCEENGAAMVLIKIPTCIYPQIYSSAWTKIKHEIVKKLAKEKGISFFDLQYDEDIGIDFSVGTVDGGRHLNFRGALKATDAMEKYLLKNYSLFPVKNETYDKMLPIYQKVCKVAFLQTETDFDAYMDMILENLDNWTIFIAALDDYTSGMNEENYSNFKKMGLKLICDGKFRDAYVAAIEKGTVIYEAISDRKINCELETHIKPVVLSSSGWNQNPQCTIKIDGQNYAICGRGLNIVIYDNESNIVIDSVAFDTFDINKSAIRDNVLTSSLLSNYENILSNK